MEYEKINPNQSPDQSPESSRFSWKWIIIVVAILFIAGFIWYLYRQFYVLGQYPSPAAPQPQAQEQTQPSAGNLTTGDTTSDIAKDLNQVPNDSVVEKELNSLDQDLQNF